MRTATILLACILGIALLAGCAAVTYKTADGTEVTYRRFLISQDSIEATVGGATVKANGQRVDNAALIALISAMATQGK